MSEQNPPMDWWGLVQSAKRFVELAQLGARRNPASKDAHNGAKAVLGLFDTPFDLKKMYDSVGIPPPRPRYNAPPLGSVCTAKALITISNADFELVHEFWMEISWMKDAREKYLTAADRLVYIENRIIAEAMIEVAHRAAEKRLAGESCDWSTSGIGVREWRELQENTRTV